MVGSSISITAIRELELNGRKPPNRSTELPALPGALREIRRKAPAPAMMRALLRGLSSVERLQELPEARARARPGGLSGKKELLEVEGALVGGAPADFS